MNLDLKTGDSVLLEINHNDVFYGVFVKGNAKCVELCNMVQLTNKTEINAKYTFWKEEITSIRLLEDNLINSFVKGIEHLKIDDKEKSLEPETTDCNIEPIKLKTVLIDHNEFFNLEEMVKKHIYIDTFDVKYFNAIKDLENSLHIGVVALGLFEKKENSKINVLILSSWQNIYVIDLRKHLKNFPPEIKNIFVSEDYKKVIYNGIFLNQYLVHRHNIVMKNVTDLYILDMAIVKSLYGRTYGFYRSLSQCLDDYFHLPQGIINDEIKLNDLFKIKANIDRDRKLQMAQLVVYLIPLKKYLFYHYFHYLYLNKKDIS